MENVIDIISALGDKKLGIYWKVDDKFRGQKCGKFDIVETFNTEKECKEFITGKKETKQMDMSNYENSSETKKRAPRGIYQAFIKEMVRLYEGRLTENHIVLLSQLGPEFIGLDSKTVEASIRFYFRKQQKN